MADKFDKFTKRARRVLTFAQEEAQRLSHNYIGTEHILLGLIREEEGLAAKVLKEMGVDQTRVRQVIKEIVGEGQAASGARLSLTPRTKRVIELAVDEARRMGHHYIGTEHLLLGLIREGDGIAVNVLKSMGVSPDKIRTNLSKAVMEAAPYPAEGAQQQPQKKRGESKTPLLDQLAIDLTALAEDGKLDPVIGRQKEIERVIQILSRRTKNNPALIGEPGVGKTAIVEGLAERILKGDVPAPLLNKRVLQLDVGSLVAGTIYRGQFEERMKRVIDEIKGSKSILFIDELHMVVGAGAAGSAVDAANILKPALARGELQCIGATTLEEYRKHIESDAALERRFQPVKVEEPSILETIEILKGVRERYEQHHALKISDEALNSAANLAARYVTDRFLPDKAIDLIDEASSRVRMYKAPKPQAWKELNAGAHQAETEKDELVEQELFEDAIPAQDREQALKDQLRLNWGDLDSNVPIVTAEDIAEVVSMWTGVPVTQLSQAETERLLKMEEALHGRIVGQEDAITIISKAVRRARAGLKDPRRPIGSFIFLGPTGVGKSELAKALAEFMFGSENALVQIDMSEFMERHNVSRLVGAPPGYIGYEEGGQLTEAIRRRPYSVILLDEIEKAHPEAFNLLLQILEDGHLADAKGRKVDFRNAIIIMTSNIGADLIERDSMLGFSPKKAEAKSQEDAYTRMREKLMSELKRLFRPEFLNRIDGIVVFRALTKDDITQIVDIQLRLLQPRLDEHHLKLTLTDEAKELLGRDGYDQQFGARPLKRTIQRLLEDPLSEGVLSGEFKDGSSIEARVTDGQLKLMAKEDEGEQANEELIPTPA